MGEGIVLANLGEPAEAAGFVEGGGGGDGGRGEVEEGGLGGRVRVCCFFFFLCRFFWGGGGGWGGGGWLVVVFLYFVLLFQNLTSERSKTRYSGAEVLWQGGGYFTANSRGQFTAVAGGSDADVEGAVGVGGKKGESTE